MKTTSPLFLCLLWLAATVAGCGQTDYHLTDPAPQLRITVADTAYERNKTIPTEISVQQSGAEGLPQLYITIPQGSASVTIDGAPLQTFRKWFTLTCASAQLNITPTKAGMLRVLLQAKSAEGVFSNSEEPTFEVREPQPLNVEIASEKRIVNLPSGETIPLALSIHSPENEGPFQVRVTCVSGKGDLLHEGHIINDIELQLGAETTIQYRPAQLGMHLLEVEASSDGISATGRAYMEVIRDIQVTSDVDQGFTISGTGEYDTDGEEVTLRLVNDSKYNFEVSEWLDNAGNVLSREDHYTITTSCDCPCDLKVNLKRRLVNISRGTSVTLDYKYWLLVNDKPTPYVVHDHRMQIEADYRVSEPLKFRYEYSRYEIYPLPPPVTRRASYATIVIGASLSSYMWSVDNVFDISIHKEDNPELVFNTYGRFVASPSTLYRIPVSITMKP